MPIRELALSLASSCRHSRLGSLHFALCPHSPCLSLTMSLESFNQKLILFTCQLITGKRISPKDATKRLPQYLRKVNHLSLSGPLFASFVLGATLSVHSAIATIRPRHLGNPAHNLAITRVIHSIHRNRRFHLAIGHLAPFAIVIRLTNRFTSPAETVIVLPKDNMTSPR